MKKKIALGIIGLLMVVGIGFIVNDYVNQQSTPIEKKSKPQKLKLVAIGDSLTYGVGDSTKKGGYVTLVSKKLEEHKNVNVSSENYGISGETSTQIIKRIENKSKIQSDLKNADIITVTVGGNDLMHILSKKGLKLKKQDVTSGTVKFENNLNTLITDIRKNNNHAPIYLISIYNPFGVYLKDIKYMTTAVKNWNEYSKQTASENYNVHFVNIDKLLSDPKKKTKDKNGDVENPYLFTEDHFHPNDKGYKLITDELYKVMIKSEDSWLETE
ncbi:lipase/acylhydrolase [Companilactobacillus sp. RD055328]|uniref:SGNH/GDSL hydrolase family protein n=1 Tax=Companilactobacillus sp. RD055328 TaxID=2916634 RepID=UPI001FC83E82|nr:SGNH/GDSL hydrolase family protein [Companilactobacillus sp. RD055328]GKQ42725.1 lipase/acylhydrolase [Companilactobacillus sp. RD055328]